MNQRQKPLVVKQHQVSRGVGGRSGRSIGFSVLAALVLLGPVILAAEPFSETRESSSGSGGASGLDLEGLLVDDGSFDPVNGDWAGLLAGLPPHLSPEVALGEHAHWVFDRDGDEVKLREQPETLGGIFDLVHMGAPFERLDIPEPPAGPEPLLQAIQVYAEDLGVELPDVDLLRVQIALLRLVPEAEAALAQLLVAYHEAVRLQEEALRGLSPEDLALLSKDTSAKASWLEEDPERSLEDYEAYRTELSGRVDQNKQLVAADLLGRTIDQVREPLALPAAPVAHAQAALAEYQEQIGDAVPEGTLQSNQPGVPTGPADGDDMGVVYRLIAQATGSEFDASTWPGVGHSQWDKVYGLIATSTGFDPDDIPSIPQESLPQALRGLATTLGVPGETLELPPELDALPSSLSNALAQIVTARKIGLESGDARVHTFLLLEATRQAQPALEAWAALLDLERHATSHEAPVMDQREFLLELLQGDPQPSVVLAHSQGLGLPELPELPPSLGVILEREGVPADVARESVEALPVPVSLSAAYVLEAKHRLETVRFEALSSLDGYALRAVEGDLGKFAELLAKESWTHDEARLVEAWARGLQTLDPQELLAVRQAQLDVLVAVEVAVALAGAYADAVETGAALVDLLDPELVAGLGIGDLLVESVPEPAGEDSKRWYQRVLSFLSGRLVVPASAQDLPEVPDVPDVPQVIDPSTVCPGQSPLARCHDDVWLNTRGWSPDGREILITGFGDSTIQRSIYGNPMFMLDLGGDDTYVNVAAGGAWADDDLVAMTPVRVAIDLGGDDTYRTDADWQPVAQGAARGFGTMGVLWNRAGDDTYRYTGSGEGAQGFGAQGGIGILIDEGGDDHFEAKDAWGHGVGRGPALDLIDIPQPSHEDECGGPLNIVLDEDRRQCWIDFIQGYPVDLLEGMMSYANSFGVLLNTGMDYESVFHAGRGQGYAEGTNAFALLYNEGRPTEYTTEFSFNPLYQGGHNRGDLARGFLIDLGGAGSKYSNLELPGTAQFIHNDPEAEPERQDGAIWIDSSTVGSGVGIDQDPNDLSDPGFVVNMVLDLLGDCIEEGSDPFEDCPGEDDVVQILDDVSDSLFPLAEDGGLCYEVNADGSCGTPLNLLYVGGTSDDVVDEPAHIMIQLGGNNHYVTEVAGTAHFSAPDGEGGWIDMKGVGSYALDLSGDDHFDTPDMSYTQGAFENNVVLADLVDHRSGVSLLINMAGDNLYEANDYSQGAILEDGNAADVWGAAWLIDFEGNDTYISESRSQGHAHQTGGYAGLIDLSGDDDYVFEVQATVEDLGGGMPIALVFDGGGNDTFTGNGGTGWTMQGHGPQGFIFARGVFIADGPEFNRYFWNEEDFSGLKNNVTDLPRVVQGQNEVGGEQTNGLFSDFPLYEYSHEDSDGDGAPNLVETLAGTDPDDPDNHPGTMWGSPTDLDASDAWLRIPGALAIFGRGDSMIDEDFPVIVSLGGNNTYTAPGVGGANTGVALLLDVGEGDNVYTPTGCGPSMGGADTGIAILADTGGSNLFRSGQGCTSTRETQGAAEDGVGILVTWNATNRFEALSADRAQGSVNRGYGFLAAFGTRDNFFTAPSGDAQGRGSNGVGVLWTGTGNDTFASGGNSQGSGSLGLGLLYSAGGNDVFRVTDETSQGAGGGNGVGSLVNVGGDNQYLAPGVDLVQGAGVGIRGVGILMDLGGQDTYVAENRAQGYEDGSGVLGLLFDLQGRDTYVLAGTDGQGFTGGASCGILIDGGGEDHYEQGGMDRSEDRQNTITTQEEPCGIHIDDEELHEILVDMRDGFSQSLGEVELEVFQGGEMLQENFLGSGVLTLRAIVTLGESDPEDVRRVSFFQDNRTLGQGQLVEDNGNGELVYEYAWDTVGQGFPDGDYVLRASATTTVGDVEGLAALDYPGAHSNEVPIRVDNPPGLETEFTLSIPENVVGVDEDVVWDFLEAPELDGAVSPQLGYDFTVGFTIGRDLDFPDGGVGEVPCIVDGLGLEEGWEVEEEGGQCLPGGFLNVTVENEQESYIVFDDAYLPNGTFSLNVAPFNETGTPWEDGLYNVTITLTDAAGVTNETAYSLLVDGSPPESRITTPSVAGLAHGDRGSGFLELGWEHMDNWSAVRAVEVYELDEDGKLKGPPFFEDPLNDDESSNTTVWSFQTDGTGSVLYFFTTAIDVLGNQEHPCSDDWPCLPGDVSNLMSTIEVDFHEPVIDESSVTLTPETIAPEDLLVVKARVEDKGSGIDQVLIRFEGDSAGQPMDCGDNPLPDTDPPQWVCTYNEWDGAGYFAGFPEGRIREDRYTFTITAVDQAGNLDEFVGSGFIDEEPPRVVPLGVTYLDGEVEHSAGRPGFQAVIRVDIEEHLMGTLKAIVSEVAAHGIEEVTCSEETTNWKCEFTLRDDLADGEYEVSFEATDAVGNQNPPVSETIVVRGQPVQITDMDVVQGHDWFRVEWTTSLPATSEVDYGRISHSAEERLDHVARDPGHRTEHSVTVTDLNPSTRYFFQIYSENTAGVPSQGERFSLTTLNAYAFHWEGVEEDEAVRGDVVLETDMEILSDQGVPVQTRVLLQEVRPGDPSPSEVSTFAHHDGPGQVTIPTRMFADGDYRFVFELNRLGDFNRSTSDVFRIDNTAPVVVPLSPTQGAAVADARPRVELDLMDPMGRGPPRVDTLVVHVDGATHSVPPHTVDIEATGPDEKRVSFPFPVPLPHGVHEVNVSVEDEAGNLGESGWSFRVDLAPPRLEGEVEVTPLPGPQHLKPGGQVRVSAVLMDESHVTNATLDLTPLGGEPVTLLSFPGDRWEATAQIPEDAPHGAAGLELVVTDSLGNQASVANLSVFVDAHGVEVASVSAVDVDYTSVVVRLETDKPSRAWAGLDEPPKEFASEDPDAPWQERHDVRVTGLRPDTQYEILVEVVDQAGHRAQATLEVETLVDDDPPGAVGNLTAVSPEEGVVVLEWDPALDNAGIDHYVVTRDAAPRAEPFTGQAPEEAGTFRDTHAPAGREVTYHVHAIDLAGNEGPRESVTVRVVAVPVLLDAAVTPLQGGSDKPFTFQVTYRHAGDRPADEAYVFIGNDRHPLTLQEDTEPCHEGCVLEVSLHLSPTVHLARVSEASFHATTEGHAADSVALAMPFVHRSASEGGILFGQELEAAPGPAALVLILLLMALLGAVSLSRKRRYDE